jgi:hypothetical protein
VELRFLSVMKRDLLLGVDKFYIKGAIKVNPESVPSLFIRYLLSGCVFSFQVVAWLLDKVISSVNVGGSSTCVGRLFETGVSSRAWGLQLKFYAEKSGFTKEEFELVHQYLAIAEKNGSDIRLDLDLPFCPKAWPRVGLSPKAWHRRFSQDLCFEPGCLQDMDEAWAHHRGFLVRMRKDTFGTRGGLLMPAPMPSRLFERGLLLLPCTWVFSVLPFSFRDWTLPSYLPSGSMVSCNQASSSV